MKRWDITQMLDAARKLFASIYKHKHHAHHNNDIHHLAREIDEWLPQSVQSLVDGTYDSRCLKRYYFSDEVVDQLHLTDRILQHVLLKQIKPTFKHVMNPNCYHLAGPTGVKYATERVKKALLDDQPNYIIRADIKSFYKSIPHYKLIQDIKKYYDDAKVQAMLERIIKNPIDTPRGYINPGCGIALRGPLSQFFSAIYLKQLDDAFNNMNVTYVRFQDDLLIMCKTKRQLNRCRRVMYEVLHERQLSLSRKKSRIGCIKSGFHFLGIHYFPTQTENKTNVKHVNDDSIVPGIVYSLVNGGGNKTSYHQTWAGRIVPHPRTLRKARLQVQLMVHTGFSTRHIRNYLHRFILWWVTTTKTWRYEELIKWFCDVCFDKRPRDYATGLLCRYVTKSHSLSAYGLQPHAGLAVAASAA